jgi:hypothetical protein
VDLAAVKLLEQRRYTPAMKDGRPAEADYTFRVDMRAIPCFARPGR